MMMMPKIGDTVRVMHKIHWDNGMPVCVKDNPTETSVVDVYWDGRIKVVSGDVWKVKKVNDYWMTTGEV